MNVRIDALAVYPVKSCAGIAVPFAQVEASGLCAAGARDREWMIVDASGRFVTQREYPALALVRADASAAHLELAAPGAAPLSVPRPRAAEGRDVVVWQDTVSGFDAGDDAAGWLSAHLGHPVRLVRFDDSWPRLCNRQYAGDTGAQTLFADGYPVLVIGRASLGELNRRLAAGGRDAVTMERFRPNVVVDGLEPHDEDHVTTIETDGVTLRLVKPCTRCTITTVDPATGRRADEPLATLGGYRMDGRWGGITFGMNAIVTRPGTLRVGDAARVTFAF